MCWGGVFSSFSGNDKEKVVKVIKYCGFPHESTYQVGSYSGIHALMSKSFTGISKSHNRDGDIQLHECTCLRSGKDIQITVTILSKWDTDISREL